MSIHVGPLISFLEELSPKNVYRVPYVSAELHKCGLEVTEMIKGNGIIINGRRIEVAQPEWGEPGLYSLHLLGAIYEILTGRAPQSDMEGRGFWYRDVLRQLKAFHSEEQNESLKIVYVDMDNVLVDFSYGIACLSEEDRIKYEGNYDECPNIFSLMRPLPDALESYRILASNFDTYILSTSPWKNPTAWIHKLEWVQKHLGANPGDPAYKRLILTHHKDLNRGDFLIADRDSNGAGSFQGEHIWFGTAKFPDWKTVIDYLMKFV